MMNYAKIRSVGWGCIFMAVCGCTGQNTDLPIPLFNIQSEEFFDTPWPSDIRVDAEGYVSLQGFPNPEELPLLSTYTDAMSQRQGFGTNSPVYFRFGTPLSKLNTYQASASLEPDAPIRLINIDPYSPHVGERIPIQLEFFELATKYTPANLLAVAPYSGFPLRPNTKYAVIITTDIAASRPEFQAVWDEDHPQHSLYAPLRDALVFESLVPEDLAVATVFTTADPVRDMATMSQFLRENINTPVLDQTLKLADDFVFYDVYTGFYPGPLFQHGERPYEVAGDGGGFRFEENGAPIIAEWELMRIAVTIPPAVWTDTAPEGGWPVTIYQHGTGGNYRSIGRKNEGMAVAAKLAEANIIGIGIDQPLHGTRATSNTSDNHSFNFLNPEAALGNFRQGALDAIYLSKALTERQVTFTLPRPDGTGEIDLPIDTERVLFMGHSQGALTGAIALPWLSSNIQGAVISAGGGGLYTTLIERKDPIDIRVLIQSVLGFEEGTVLTELHPVTGLIQNIVEPTDPMNYAPLWFHEEGYWEHKSASVLLTSGQHDTMTPHSTSEALAAAAHMGIIQPTMNDPVALKLRNIEPVANPTSLNLVGFDGEPVTAALSQWRDGDHFVVFDIAEAAAMYRDFLAGALDGKPVIDNNL